MNKVIGNWAILPEYFEQLCQSGFGEPKITKEGFVNQKNRYTIEDGVAVLHIDGALSFKSDIFSAWFGFDTYESIGSAFDDLQNNKDVQAIVLSIDSPGGLCSGVSDLAQKINESIKPVFAHTAGMACSAAYWIASACDKVYASCNAEVGSIGTMVMISKSGEENYRIIRSDLSKFKNLSLDTKEGEGLMKDELNQLTQAFIDEVARFRNVSSEHVFENYGQGKVFVGKKAVEHGLADGVKSLKQTINLIKKGFVMDKKEQTKASAEAIESVKPQAVEMPIDVEALKAEAIQAERARATDIRKVFAGLDMNEDCERFVDEGKSKEEALAFAFENLKKQFCDSKKEKPESELSAEQKCLIEKGLEVNAKDTNSIVAGSNDSKVKYSEEEEFFNYFK